MVRIGSKVMILNNRSYNQFLVSKQHAHEPCGFIAKSISEILFPAWPRFDLCGLRDGQGAHGAGMIREERFSMIVHMEPNTARKHNEILKAYEAGFAYAATGDTSPTPAWISHSLLHSTAWNAGRADAAKALRASAVAQ